MRDLATRIQSVERTVNRPPRVSTTTLVIVVILTAAAVARLWGIGFGLPHPQCRPDEEAISAIAGGFRTGDLNPHVFNYPALFMLVVAAVLRLLPLGEGLLHKLMPFHFHSLLDGVSVTETNYMVARLLSAAAGVASVWVIFRIGRRLFDRHAAVAAAALLSVAFLHVRDSHFGVTDVPMSFMVLIAFAAAVRLAQSGTRKDLILAGVTAGLAASTKYNGALVALPVLFAVFVCPAPRERQSRFVDSAVALLLMGATFLCTSPYTLLEFGRFFADLSSDAEHLSDVHGVNLGRGWIYHATTTLRFGVGLPLLVAGVAGMALLLWRDLRTGVLVALFPVSYYALLGSGYTVFTRHMTPVVPFLCLTGAYFTCEISGSICARLKRPTWRPALAGIAVVGVLWPSIHSVVMFDTLIARPDSRLLARRWIEERFPPGTAIAQTGPRVGHLYLGEDRRYALVEMSSRAARPDLVVVQSSPVTAPPELGDMGPVLKADYSLEYSRHVAPDDPRNVYDRQDEFYMPFAGFHVERPGPNLDIYVRRTLSWTPPAVVDRK